MNNIGKRSHVLKHSHGRCVIGAFDKKNTKALFGPVIELFCRLSFTNKYYLTFCMMVQDFMTYIYHHKIIIKYIDDDGSSALP